MSETARPQPMTWRQLMAKMLPFADSATTELPLGQLLRLGLFQVSVGMAAVLLTGTLNRVMIVELGISGWVVALMVSLPLVFAPLRALIGFKSDTHRSVLGWRRGPYIWFGSMLQFGGFAIMPFALLILSGDTHGPIVVGEVAAALAFLLVGIGMHTTQTAGLALATDLAPPEARPRVVALLYVMLLAGMLFSALFFGLLLADFSALRLIQVIQGAAVVTMVLNCVALWKQEVRNTALTAPDRDHAPFAEHWRALMAGGRTSRLLFAVGFGAAAFSMQDVLLEPYGAQVLGLSVGETTALTALWSWGALCGFALAAHRLGGGDECHRLAGYGALVGIVAFSLVIFAAPLNSTPLFCVGVAGIGFGGGLFAVGTLTAAMALTRDGQSGLALGAWGAVQATAAGIGIAVGGAMRDVVGSLAESGALGAALAGPATGYGFVYHLEIGLLFAALIAIGPLARHASAHPQTTTTKFGMAEFPT
jgi:BCD family chlorophyll transporter-like MFS transporter